MTPLMKKWLLRYVMTLATLAFIGRAIPYAFLSLVLKTDFHQSQGVVGLIMALYPLAALLATPVAAKIARSTKRIVTLHSGSLVMIAGALALSAAAPAVQRRFGDEAGILWLAAGRVCQGVGASFYLSSNTSLLARKFPDQLTFAIAMTEVMVGMGGQIGRVAGGFLFDIGGMALPFLLCAALQASIALGGFAFEEDVASNAPLKRPALVEKTTLPWATLITPRLLVGALAVFVVTFTNGFLEATLLPFLAVHLAPLSVGEMSLVSCWRPMSYLFSSFMLAPLMRHEALSCEFLMCIGSLGMMVGLLLQAPQPFALSLVSWLFGLDGSWWSRLGVVLASFVMVSGTSALLFVPSLPLMQHEVRRHGQMAVEQVAELFVIMMTLGEMLGPIVGGWLTQEFGFTVATLALSCLFLLPVVLSFASYDSAVIRARRIERPVQAVDGQELDVATAAPRCGPQCAVPTDGEANFAVRRLVFAIDVKYNDSFVAQPSTAPPEAFRRSFGELASPLLDYSRVPQTAPSQAFRKHYEPSSGSRKVRDTEGV